MNLNFTKMHGLGNDFVVIDAINQTFTLNQTQYQQIANRHLGIGCDQILLVESPLSDHAEFRYRIINSDGSEVEQCGNGARCFARFVLDQGLTQNKEIVVETNTGIIVLNALDEHHVTVNMGIPQFSAATIPILAKAECNIYELSHPSGETVSFSVANIGNPHAVMLVEDVDTASVESLGPWMETHSFFPERVNVGFMQCLSPQAFRLRVFERGVGETHACGSGACAAMAIGQRLSLLDDKATAHLRGGDLQLHYEGEAQPVFMTGPTSHVFDGCIEL